MRICILCEESKVLQAREKMKKKPEWVRARGAPLRAARSGGGGERKFGSRARAAWSAMAFSSLIYDRTLVRKTKKQSSWNQKN